MKTVKDQVVSLIRSPANIAHVGGSGHRDAQVALAPAEMPALSGAECATHEPGFAAPAGMGAAST